MNLYDQLLALQVIEHAYEEWSEYREALTSWIIKAANGGEEVAILGAGRCNDIDLGRLVGAFKKVTLLDKDLMALKEGVRHQGLMTCGTIQLQVVDFLGITEEDYRGYADCLIAEVRKHGKQIECSRLAQMALEYLGSLSRKIEENKMRCLVGSYDVVVAVGIHSQLLSILEWIWQIILQTIEQEEETVRHFIMQLNAEVVEQFNDQLLALGKKRILIGCEVQRLERLGAIQGAYQALEDIRQRVNKGDCRLANQQSMTWPFHKAQEITYIMQMLEVSK